MKVIWIILWATLVSFCLTAPVDDINLNERPKDELLSMIESLNDKLPFLSGLRYWIAELPDFKDPLKITEFTHWYETIVFPEMKRAVPIVAEALAHGGSRSSKDQDSYDTVRGLRAITHLLGRIRLDLANVSNQNVPIELHQALHNWTLVYYKYVFERQHSTIMGLSRGFIQKPTVSRAEGFNFVEQIVSGITHMKYVQFIHNLYETGTTIEQKIYGDFVQSQNDVSFSIEKIEQFITKYHPNIVHYQEKLSIPRFIEIVNVKYIPASTVENSDNPEPSHTLTSDNPDGDSLGAKLKRPSIERTRTLETPIQSSKRQKPLPKDSVSLNLHSALLNAVLSHTKFIDMKLSQWIRYEKITPSIELFTLFSKGLENHVNPWMENIEIIYEYALLFLEWDTLKSLDPAIKTLNNVYNFRGKLFRKFPKEVYESVTFARFWKLLSN